MKRSALSVSLLVCFAVLAVSVTGCEMIAQKATEKGLSAATGGAVNVSGDSVTLKGKDGTEATVSGDNKIPADFPKDVPMRDDGTVNAVITNQAPGGGTGYMLNIRFKIPQTELLEWYNTQLKDGGWTIVSTVSTGDGGMVAAEKGDLTINVVTGSETQDGFTSVVTMQVAPKAK